MPVTWWRWRCRARSRRPSTCAPTSSATWSGWTGSTRRGSGRRGSAIQRRRASTASRRGSPAGCWIRRRRGRRRRSWRRRSVTAAGCAARIGRRRGWGWRSRAATTVRRWRRWRLSTWVPDTSRWRSTRRWSATRWSRSGRRSRGSTRHKPLRRRGRRPARRPHGSGPARTPGTPSRAGGSSTRRAGCIRGTSRRARTRMCSAPAGTSRSLTSSSAVTAPCSPRAGWLVRAVRC
jgi:hypothetical protein